MPGSYKERRRQQLVRDRIKAASVKPKPRPAESTSKKGGKK